MPFVFNFKKKEIDMKNFKIKHVCENISIFNCLVYISQFLNG